LFCSFVFFFFQAEDGIRDRNVTGVQTCALPILQEVYGKPFQAAIAKGGLRGVMPCYCLIDGEPVHASRKLLTGLLREEMGFAGEIGRASCRERGGMGGGGGGSEEERTRRKVREG